MDFEGNMVALVTPFRNGSVDRSALADLIEHVIAGGVSGVVPCGTTGESPTLSDREHRAVVEKVVELAKPRGLTVIAGAGSNSTREAVTHTRHARECGADAALVVLPYYNKPTPAGVVEHFRAVAAEGLPVVIYNIPGRCVVDMSVETMARLFELPNIAGVKDATAKLDRVTLQRLAMGPTFNQLSGEDGTALAFMAHGGHGCISVSSNVAPKQVSDFQEACLAGDFSTALERHDRLMPLHTALFLEPSPAGAKYALSVLGRMSDELRLPMFGLSNPAKTEIREAMVHAGLIN